ncbi:MAG: DUF192 domain-containing protein [Gammaproteobacteria bacterium]|nr:DUF192 domain-containing protein [Gammaproteobacteria bacterium]
MRVPTPSSTLRRTGLLALLLLTAPACGAPSTTPDALDDFAGWPRGTVEIRTRAGPQRFQATVADTPARQQRGLMFVRALTPEAGMWFPQRPPRVMRMWMQNTLIPLDMLFVDARGRIACIHAQATPESLAIISCAQPVRGVLEIKGGEASRRGMAPRDVVRFTGAR